MCSECFFILIFLWCVFPFWIHHWRFVLLRFSFIPPKRRDGYASAVHAGIWWHILTRAGNVTICPACTWLRLAVTGFGPWLKGACPRDFLCRTTKRILKGSWEEMAAEPLFIIQGSSGALPRQQSISAAIHHRPECCWEGGSQAFWPRAGEAPNEGLGAALPRKPQPY